jgi:hypothetical protein
MLLIAASSLAHDLIEATVRGAKADGILIPDISSTQLLRNFDPVYSGNGPGEGTFHHARCAIRKYVDKADSRFINECSSTNSCWLHCRSQHASDAVDNRSGGVASSSTTIMGSSTIAARSESGVLNAIHHN